MGTTEEVTCVSTSGIEVKDNLLAKQSNIGKNHRAAEEYTPRDENSCQ